MRARSGASEPEPCPRERLTTFTSYGVVSRERQADILNDLRRQAGAGTERIPTRGPCRRWSHSCKGGRLDRDPADAGICAYRCDCWYKYFCIGKVRHIRWI